MQIHNSPRAKTDAEKAALGQKKDRRYSEEAQAERLSANVFAHPTLTGDIPEPEMDLDSFGARKYFALCRQLQRTGRLTTATMALAEQAAIHYMTQNRALKEGKRVPAYVGAKLTSIMSTLKLVEDAKPLAASLRSQKDNRFARFGFAARASKAARLSAPSDR